MSDTAATATDLVNLFESILYPPRLASLDPSKMVPPTLYHYTGASGVAGILKDTHMRATNFSFLNDPSEVPHGHELVLRILRQEKELRRNNDKIVLQEIERSFTTEQTVSEVYVCCFTECLDDLGQWRAYGTATGTRFCIGFDSDALHSQAKSLDAVFTKVDYKERDQCDLIQEVINKTIAFVTEKGPSQHQTQKIAESTARRLGRLLPQLKSPAYKAEEEWRMILWVDATDVSEVCFDAARGVLRPYVTFPLMHEHENHLPVVELLVLAPGREGPSVKAADMLLRKAGISGVKAEPSKVPFAE